MITAKHIVRKIKRRRVRNALKATLRGTAQRPRLIMIRSNKYLYTQVIDDASHNVLLSASTLEKELRAKLKSAKDKAAAKLLGETIAERLKEKRIAAVVFDRNVYSYAGRVKVFSDAAREKGIRF
ncbi:MAG: 50S ribosomal protein L18 [Candidatus Aminicenantes bacterium]|nr:50S ribosomal protein L18 [Candidatus Aminicenantes bacterium]